MVGKIKKKRINSRKKEKKKNSLQSENHHILLKSIYYNPQEPGSFSSIDRLRKNLKRKEGINLKENIVKNWLAGQDAYTLHRKLYKKFPRNPYKVNNIDDVWEADLVDLQKIKSYNKQMRYLLNVIDVFSKYAWSIPIKTKSGDSIVKAFASILKSSGRKPIRLQTDKGSEFLNSTFQSFLKKNNIEYNHTHNPDIKAAIVERFHRTLLERMYRYFSANSTLHYLNILQKILLAYNNSYHTSIGMSPASVSEDDVLSIWERLKSKWSKNVTPHFKAGDYCRISKEKLTFSKGYETNYSREIFKIDRVLMKKPRPVYLLVDLQNRPIVGQFYNEELVKVNYDPENTLFKIDKILRSRRRGRILEHYVKWLGYDNSFNSWIKESDLKKFN